MNPETKTCQNCKNDFLIEEADFNFYTKIQSPPPTFCPDCRLQRRLAWRNERGLYRRKCDKCDKAIISVFPQDSGYVVYCRPCWWSDSWNGLEYGAEYDSAKPFFSQLDDLLHRTPVMCLFGLYHTLHNSDYVNMATELKNCYMLTHSDYCEDSSYGSMISGCKESVDNLMLLNGELCYETVNCQKCYRTRFSMDCESCTDVWFSRNCVGCSDCFGCVNLRSQKYHIFNQPYTKEEYERKMKEFNPSSYENILQLGRQARKLWRTYPQKFIHDRHGSNVSGDYIYNSKNTRDSFVANDMEDSRFCSLVTPGKTTNAYDFTHYGIATDLMYETLQSGQQSSRIRFSWFTLANSQNVEYGMFNIGSKDSFGNVSVKKRQYCILNKQYSKEEYEKLRDQILKDMDTRPYVSKQGHQYRYGEFFPTELSPFSYRITTAQESFPLSEDEVKQAGYTYRSPERSNYTVSKEPETLPDTIAEVDDSILNDVIGCMHHGTCPGQCTTAFRLTPAELQFYRRMDLPLPRLCPSCRFDERLTARNPFKLWKRACQCAGPTSQSNEYTNTGKHFHGAEVCPNTFTTAYPPEGDAVVYCQQCYQAEVA